jgi:hypothetical protein
LTLKLTEVGKRTGTSQATKRSSAFQAAGVRPAGRLRTSVARSFNLIGTFTMLFS